jgi:hypothetical protein
VPGFGAVNVGCCWFDMSIFWSMRKFDTLLHVVQRGCANLRLREADRRLVHLPETVNTLMQVMRRNNPCA